MFGVARLAQDLRELGFAVETVTAGGQPFAVVRTYEVQAGRFEGRTIDLGLPAPPNFPQAVGSAIHIRAAPQLFDKRDTRPGVRNILDSPLGPEWRYWSLNFGQGDHSARRLLSQINGVFARA